MSKVEEITLKGLPALRLTDASGAVCDVYKYGAHVATWKSADGIDNLFVSSTAEIGGGKALRGGIPVCWPQFAAKGQYGKHGFCRNSAEWTVVRTSTEPFPCVVLGLSSSDATKAAWPFDFSLRYAVTIDGPQSLSTSLTITNPGEAPIEFTGALHTYFCAEHAGCVQAHGLEGCTFENSAAGGGMETQSTALLGFEGEVDRIYYQTPPELHLLNLSAGRHMKVLKMGFPDAVAWNIGKAKAPTLKDLDNFEKYVCLEAGLIGKPYSLPPNASYTAGQTFTAGVEMPKGKKKAAVEVQ